MFAFQLDQRLISRYEGLNHGALDSLRAIGSLAPFGAEFFPGIGNVADSPSSGEEEFAPQLERYMLNGQGNVSTGVEAIGVNENQQAFGTALAVPTTAAVRPAANNKESFRRRRRRSTPVREYELRSRQVQRRR